MLITKSRTVVIARHFSGQRCPRCVLYQDRIEELERKVAEWERAALLSDTRNQIRYRTATDRMRRGLPPIPDN